MTRRKTKNVIRFALCIVFVLAFTGRENGDFAKSRKRSRHTKKDCAKADRAVNGALAKKIFFLTAKVVPVGSSKLLHALFLTGNTRSTINNFENAMDLLF